jgi:hypothetical protein
MPSPRLAPLVLVYLLLWPAAASAEAAAIDLPTQEEIEDAVPEGASLTGREIYERFHEQRILSGIQYQSVISRDPSGAEQRSRFWVRWKDYRDENNEPVDGVIAKTVVKFLDPFDMRHTGLLVVTNKGRDPDQFIYQPSARRVRRVKLQGVGVGGTDFGYDDIAFNNLEAADFVRLPDDELEGGPVYVVESTLKPFVDSDYRTSTVWFEKEHYIPLHAVYRDESGVEIKESRARRSSIKEFDGSWVATEVTMYNLKEGTSSVLLVEKLEPNVEMADRLFSLFRLKLDR